MASFSAPLLFGGNVRVLTLEIFTARQRGDQTMAVTETVILALISLGALVLFQRYEGTRKFAAAAMKGARQAQATLRKGRPRTAGVCLWRCVLDSARLAGCDSDPGELCSGG